VRWRYFPRALPWLLRYLTAAWTDPKIERTAHALRTLLAGAPALHQHMAQQAGVGELIERNGLLHAFLSREHFLLDAKAWEIRRKEGVSWQELDATALADLEPDLAPKYTFGVFVAETGSCRNPGAYTAALIRHAQTRGATLLHARATGFRIERGNWRRAEILRDHLLTMYPTLPRNLAPEQIQIWMGRRPSTPDGLPCLGLASGSKDIIHAYGHGHVGLVGSARTGRIVAQLAVGLQPEIDLNPFRPTRFG